MKTTSARTRIAALAGVAALALAAPLTATASAPEAVSIETQGIFTGPDSTAGTFTISGAVSDSGTYVDTFRLAGQNLHVVKTLSGGGGTITLTAQGSCAGRRRRLRRSSPATGGSSLGPARMPTSRGAATLARRERRTSPP